MYWNREAWKLWALNIREAWDDLVSRVFDFPELVEPKPLTGLQKDILTRLTKGLERDLTFTKFIDKTVSMYDDDKPVKMRWLPPEVGDHEEASLRSTWTAYSEGEAASDHQGWPASTLHSREDEDIRECSSFGCMRCGRGLRRRSAIYRYGQFIPVLLPKETKEVEVPGQAKGEAGPGQPGQSDHGRPDEGGDLER